MAETERPTFEEAKRCPKCGQPGEDRKNSRGPHGSIVHWIYCVSELCPWSGTVCRLVQVDNDGTVHPPTNHAGKPKVYEGFDDHDRKAEELVNILKRNAELETRPGGAEI